MTMLKRLSIALALVAALVVSAVIADTRYLNIGSSACKIIYGSGSPESAITASVCSLYVRTDGGTGTTLYLKESGSSNTGWVPVVAPSVTASSSTVFTNKTLDAEGTGNVLTLPFTYSWMVSTCNGGGAWSADWHADNSGTNAPTFSCQASAPTTAIEGTADFGDGATEYMYRDLKLPNDWSGSIDLAFYWYTAATSGNVVWQAQTFCTAVTESMDTTSWTYNAAQTVTDAANGTASTQNLATISSLTTTGCAAGEILHLKIFRNPAHASDTIANTASLFLVELTLRRTI